LLLVHPAQRGGGARKAFLVTRIGDLGFFIGILMLWKVFGFSLDYYSKDGHSGVFERLGQASQAELTAICLLLFCGAVGKSAQFPLHVWLPDAMEGQRP